MHSNFITPPDYITTVLVVDATEQQITELGNLIKAGDIPYNIYFYNQAMNEQEWFNRIANKADTIIYADKNNPLEYFDK
jgi:hypothetical protein